MTTFLFSLERCGSGTPGVYSLENYSGFMTDKASVDDADTGGSSAQLHQRPGVVTFLAITNLCNFWAGKTSARAKSIPAAPVAALTAGAGHSSMQSTRGALCRDIQRAVPSPGGRQGWERGCRMGGTGTSCCQPKQDLLGLQWAPSTKTKQDARPSA